jgi:hypothetical protein
MNAHVAQQVLHRAQQSNRIIQYGAPAFPKVFNEDFLPGDADFLLCHMPDAHLQFGLARPHGVSPAA